MENSNFEDLKLLFNDLEAKFKETELRFKEIEARFKETELRFKETYSDLSENDEMIDRRTIKFKGILESQAKEVDRLKNIFIGDWGILLEHLADGGLKNILKSIGIKINAVFTRFKGNRMGEQINFDIIASNQDEIIITEVKTTLCEISVREFLDKLSKARNWLTEFKSHKYYGAIVYLSEEKNSASFAQKEGLLVIRATGDSASIINEPEFRPKEF